MPSSMYCVELNCFAAAILVVIFLNMRHQSRQYTLDQKLFLALIANVIVLLFLDTTVRCLDGWPGASSRALSVAAIVLYNSLNPSVCAIWNCYVDYYIYGNTERLKKLSFFMSVPLLLNAALSVSSIFSKAYFYYDDVNGYHAGRSITSLLGLCFVMILYATFSLIRNRRKIGRSEYVHLLLFALLPMAGGFIQMAVRGLDLIWVTATVSILMIFINIQKDQLHTDYLTSLFNRRYLDNYLQSIVQTKRNDLIAGIMIDIDRFKTINDRYGHDVGDQALKGVAEILRVTFRKTDFIARYGGDEFIVVPEISNRSEIEFLMQRLRENLALYNSQRTTPYEIKLSTGYACYDEECDASLAAFLKRLDHLMYSNKKSNAGAQ